MKLSKNDQQWLLWGGLLILGYSLVGLSNNGLKGLAHNLGTSLIIVVLARVLL